MGRHDASGLIAAFQQHYRDLLRFLVRRTGDSDRAADIAQETYIRLNATAAETTGVENRKAYIYRIAGNLAIDAVRREGRETAWLADHAPDDMIADPAPRQSASPSTAIGCAFLRKHWTPCRPGPG